MEPVRGISKGKRFTQRFKNHVLWCCERFTDLKAVRKHVHCSYGFLYNALYEQLELNRRKHVSPWPKIIGIDEHSFRKNKEFGHTEFVTMFVDHRNRRTFEMAHGKSVVDLNQQTSYLKNREHVSWVTMDLSSTFRTFVKQNLPRAGIVADKFHVVRQLDNHINRHRKKITGDKRKLPVRKLLLKNAKDLDFHTRSLIMKWLEKYPDLKDLYTFKQALHKFYRIKGYNRAKTAFNKLVTAMAYSRVKEVRTLRKTLIKWKWEILNYFKTGLTNARVEGFNTKAKLIKRRAYGYRSFKNYRLRVLNACC
jgi:transposase